MINLKMRWLVDNQWNRSQIRSLIEINIKVVARFKLEIERVKTPL